MAKTAKWFQVHPERGIVRVNVEHTVKVGGEELAVVGGGSGDQDIEIASLPTDIREAINDIHDFLAGEVGAERFEPVDTSEPKPKKKATARGRKR